MTDGKGNHFAAYNRFFLDGPDDEPIRVVDGKISIYTNQQDMPGAMVLSIIRIGAREPVVQYRLIEMEDGTISLPLSNGIEFRASNWLELGQQIYLRGTLPEYGDELAALFQQVGGDITYSKAFRLELYWEPSRSLT